MANVAYDPQQRIESAHLYGNIHKYAYYFTDLLIGSPNPQRASVIIDTGSRLVGFPCSGCDHCGDHLDPAYDVSQSKSARWKGCTKECDATCNDGHCPYTETYTEGSTISGYWFDDLIELGDSLQKNPPVRARLGCHTGETKLFYTQKANGIMGLAPMAEPHTDRPTIMQDLFHDKEHIDTKIFSICLATWGGRLTVGGYNSSYHNDRSSRGIQWVSMRASHYYFIFPEGLVVQGNGQRLIAVRGQQDFGVCIVDSGTTYTYFPSPVFNAIVENVNTYCRDHNNCGAQREGDECYRLFNPLAGPLEFPTLHLQFSVGFKEIAWHPSSYLHQKGETGVWCHTFMENSIFQTVLGISWMIHKDVVFDLVKGRMGVADATCPEHRRQVDLINEVSLDISTANANVADAVIMRVKGRYGDQAIQISLLSVLLVGLGALVANLAPRIRASAAVVYGPTPQALSPAGEPST